MSVRGATLVVVSLIGLGASARPLPRSRRAARPPLRVRGGEARPTIERLDPSCNVRGDRPASARLLEHSLPAALQTHEVLYEPRTRTVLATQMEEGRLLRLAVDPATGELSRRSTRVGDKAEALSPSGELGNPVESARFDTAPRPAGKPFVGLHGLALSETYPGRVWVTLQYVNRVCLVDVASLSIVGSFACPATLADGATPIGGPHSLVEKRGHLFVCMKGGASCHGPPDPAAAEDARACAVWRVALAAPADAADAAAAAAAADAPLTRDAGDVFRVPATPPMCAVDDDGACWVVCDAFPALAYIPWRARPTADDTSGSAKAQVMAGVGDDGARLARGELPASAARLVLLPYQYAVLNGCGPGVTIGPDGRPWFCVLGGDGVVGTVGRDMRVKLFELHANDWNPTPRLCHVRFDDDGVLYAISSDLIDKRAVNSLVRVRFDAAFEEVVAQHEFAMPTQATCCHRVELVPGPDPARCSVVVSELSKAQLLQVFAATLPALDRFPMKTMEVATRRV